MSDATRTFQACPEDKGRRLDQFLVAQLGDVSRARVQQLIKQELVQVNGEVARASMRLRGGEDVRVLGEPKTPPLRAVAEQIPLDVVYEDDDLAIVNKPAGMMVHAGAGATDDARNRGTLVNALLHRFASLSQQGGETRPGIVHRLDRQTSGLMVVAKNDAAHRKLAEQFSRREVHKTYLALVHGWMQRESGTVESAISRDRIRRTRMTTRRREGRDAISHWRALKKIESPYGRFSLLEVKIETGRTHQIRVHMSSLGHPVVGDTLYGAPRVIKYHGEKTPGSVTRADSLALARNFLHAAAIELKHPRTRAALSFRRPLPAELEEFLGLLLPNQSAR
ncbi:MAG TPA: RluA family pseudouridine synthase [Terriglobales bacterium]|nr:RluA family pseudouridine synthase [Terriglobales bacterium]